MPDVRYSLTTKQQQTHQLLSDDKDQAILYGGAKGGGKSFLLCLWAYTWTIHLIEFFGITNPKHPIPVGFIGRKRAVDFNDTTLETFKRIIPDDLYHIRTQEKEIIIEDKAKILFGGLDDQANINKFNSAEFCFIGIDQAEETVRQDVSVLQASLRFSINGKRPPYKQLYTANPAECWLKEDFILGSREGSIFIPALPDDNWFLPPGYKETLRNAFSYDPSLLKAYLEGDWDAFSNLEDALVKPNDVNICRTVESEDLEEDAVKVLGCDVATKHGDCYTVSLYRYGHTVQNINKYYRIPTTQIALYFKRDYEKYKCDTLVIDSDGFGEGVADLLISQNMHPMEFHGGYSSKPLDGRRFRNLRSQFYWIVSKKIEKGLYSFKNLDQETYEQLKRELCSIKVRPPDPLGRFQIETKEDMHARGIKSPDLADALVYSEYGFFMGKMGDVEAYSYR